MNKIVQAARAAITMLVLTASHLPASAATFTRAEARVDHIAVQVFDLAPADGIAPGYTQGSTSTSFDLFYDFDTRSSPVLEGPGEVSLRRGRSSASGSWQGGVGGLEVVAVAAHADASLYSIARQSVVYTVAPHSMLVIRGLVTQSRDIDPTIWSGGATTRVNLGLVPDGAVSRNEVHYTLYTYDGYDAGVYSADQFALSYANGGSEARQVIFRYDLQTYANIIAVPEPSAWLMLAVGMAGIAGAARRHRKLLG
ncbi:PEP-CTERM sorting domain-containing protein [[Empedobacter] haloabium]|uniref:PEP-CTERM sorting domain-containing protein n=1 Tax=[Empedobacter] haloabium TaxID=592317 RepID=A0ABZ1UGL3_9BURK